MEWVRLDEACVRALNSQLGPQAATRIFEMVSENLLYVEEHLRTELATCKEDGAPAEFEIDDEVPPYIRISEDSTRSLLLKLRRVDPFDFEKICAQILNKLGAQADVTKRSNDDGVDFYAIDFDFVPDGINTPQACRAAVIGQAKRYEEGNYVKETDVRAFVGGAMKVKNDLATSKKILPLSPTVFAFWTTSDFSPGAKEFARCLGIWYLSGRVLAKYVQELGLESYVDALLVTKVVAAR